MPRKTACRKCDRGYVSGVECSCCDGDYESCSNCEREDKITRWALEAYEDKRKDKTKQSGKTDSKTK